MKTLGKEKIIGISIYENRGIDELIKEFLFWLKLLVKLILLWAFLFLRLGFWMPNFFNLGKNNS